MLLFMGRGVGLNRGRDWSLLYGRLKKGAYFSEEGEEKSSLCAVF